MAFPSQPLKESEKLEDKEKSQPQVNSNGQKTALIIGAQELMKINLSNRLTKDFNFHAHSFDKTSEGIDFLTTSKTSMIVIDIDFVTEDELRRIYKLVQHIQTPCLVIGSDANFLNTLRNDLENTYFSFLPKTILNSLFKETTTLLLEKVSPSKKIESRLKTVSLSDKPLSLYILSTCLFLEPVMKIFYLKFMTGFSWGVLGRTILSIEGPLATFEFWALFPLAGLALISVQAWSFFFFIGLQAYTVYAHMTYEQFTWPYVAKTPHVSSMFLIVFNVALVAYFLIPENRRPYWNKARRLWRNTKRYATNLQTFLNTSGEKVETTITNISETGAYLTSDLNIPVGHTMNLEFHLDGEIKNIRAIVRRTQETAHDNFKGYGVEFDYDHKDDKKKIKEFVYTLETRLQ